MKSVRRVSIPESSCAILLKQSAMTSKPSAVSMLRISGTRAEKSPCIIRSAALDIMRTGRPTMNLRLTPSSTVAAALSSSMFSAVTCAALSTYSRDSSMPEVRAKVLRKSSMLHVMAKAMVTKKMTYLRREKSHPIRLRRFASWFI